MTTSEVPARNPFRADGDRSHATTGALRTDEDVVVLLDERRQPAGTAPRNAVHTDRTPLHRAFSVHLFDSAGRVLITRRALDKTTWPGVWTNSCCGHPRPGESDSAAITRRVREELGIGVEQIEVILPDFAYTARDASGVVENEVCPVFTATVTATEQLSVDPDEVMEWAWVTPTVLAAATRDLPALFSPWAVQQIAEGALRPRPDSGHSAPDHPIDAAEEGLSETMGEVDEVVSARLAATGTLWQSLATDGPVDVLAQDLPDWLGELVAVRGKRIRTIATHWGFVAAGGALGTAQHQVAVAAAAATELLHQFALVHDDVMDESDVRRGAASAHRQAERWHTQQPGARGQAEVFGRNMAILLGDLALTQANRVAANLPFDVAELWHDMCTELVLGQRADLTGAAVGRGDLTYAHHTARCKSGSYTVTRPLLLGARAANAGAEAEQVLAHWGELVGEAFALRDDLLGVWGDPALTGKPSGDDLADGKATVVLALGRQRLNGPAAEALERLGTPALRTDDVDLVRTGLEAAGVRDSVEQLVAARTRAAAEALATAPLTAEGVAGLTRLAEAIAWRTA